MVVLAHGDGGLGRQQPAVLVQQRLLERPWLQPSATNRRHNSDDGQGMDEAAQGEQATSKGGEAMDAEGCAARSGGGQ